MDLMGSQVAYLQQALGVSADRHRTIAANIANVNTPGYRALDVKFDDEMQRAMTFEREGIDPRQDGNNVVIELEHAAMSKNAMAYRVFLMAMSHESRMTKSAIAGRSV